MYDLILRGGSIADGSGGAEYISDIAVRNGKIAAIGEISASALRELDVRGKTVTPGFIDIHRHADAAVFRRGFGELELRQGLTTVINGNCGLSLAPVSDTHRSEVLTYLTPIIGSTGQGIRTESVQAYLSCIEKTPVHLGTLVGAGVLRANAAGYSSAPLTERQYQSIYRQMEQALADGAFGVSLGLGYAPECFYSTKELICALEPLRSGDIPLTVHMREEGTAVDKAAAEMLTVAQTLHCPLHISHLKAMGKRNWGVKIPKVLEMLKDARERGLDVSWDVYPYTAGSTQLLHIMPPELLVGGTEEICRRLLDPAERTRLKERLANGTDFDNISALVGWDNILMSTLNRPEKRQYAGKTVRQIAALRGQTPEDCVFDLLAEEKCTVTMIDFITAEEDIAAILKTDAVNVISDSTYPTEGKPHSRLYGTFARILDKYVRQEHILTLPEAVKKMTYMPAKALRIPRKGLLKVGYDADILIFDPAKVRENGSYETPERFASGFDVIVGGEFALLNGELQNTKNGRILRRDTDA